MVMLDMFTLVTQFGIMNCVIRRWAYTHKLALGRDLSEGSAISLSNGNELATLLADPAPGRSALASGGAQVGVALEIIEVDL